MYKSVTIKIPYDENLPIKLFEFTPEKVLLAINVGYKCILDAEQSMLELTEEMIYNKVKEETAEEIKKLETNLLVEKEIARKMDERTANKYEEQLHKMDLQIDRYKKQLDTQACQLKTYELENKDVINEAIKKEKEKYDLLLDAKEKRLDKLQEINDQIKEALLKLTYQSAAHKGTVGENGFRVYADETFMDFKGYDLIDKHTQGGSGDFHMRFEEFDLLVDAKKYGTSVPITQREKIRDDLIKNEHLTFAWLVSLNTTIDKFDKSPVMYEWINTKQCIVYINNLSQNEDPRKLLRIVWYTCKELYKLVEKETTEDLELTNLKDKQIKFMTKVKNIRKTMREINTTLNTTRNLLQVVDDQLKEILEEETEQIVASNYSVFDSWWDLNVELTNEDVRIVSTDLWTKFKHDNKLLINELEITTDKFKQYIKTKVSMSNIILKNKNANSAFEIKGAKWNSKVEKLETEQLDILLVDTEVKPERKKVITKLKDKEVYFTQELDKKILEDYNNTKNDIIKIAKNNKVEIYQVVSLLVKYNIISKRNDARGYDKYKETDEYKNKATSK
jgi:hypothetical protein